MTIYDIAKEAGVSASTVSRVINNKPGAGKATRDKINELLKKYNYYPDVAARGLASGNTRIVGVLISDIRNLHYTEGAYTIESVLDREGYNTLIFNTGNTSDSIRKNIESLITRKPACVVMIGSTFQTAAVRRMISSFLPDTPVVMINACLELSNVYGIVADERTGVRNCVSYLAQHGCRKIVFVNDADTVSNREKMQGYMDGLSGADGKNLCEPVVVNLSSTDSRYESFVMTRQLLSEDPEIDGLIYANDMIAAGGIASLRKMGKRVPEDVSVIGINNSAYAEICYPTLTSLDNKLTELSRQGARMIMQLLAGGRISHTNEIGTELVVRESTR